MALDVGGVFADAGLRVRDEGFRRFDRLMDSADRRARDDIRAHADLDVDDRGFRRYNNNLDRMDHSARSAEKSHGRLYGAVGTAGTRFAAVATGAGAAAAAVLYAGKTVVDYANDVNESLTKNQQLFGHHAKRVDAWSKSTATAIGISRKEALSAAGDYGSLFETIGLGDKPAANMSMRLTELAGDLASFNNASPEEAMEALRSGLIGEAEPMRRFGALLSETRVQQEAWSSGIAENGTALTEQQKVQARYQLILKDTNAAQGDFHRTSGGLANQLRILRANAIDLGTKIGGFLLPPVLSATKFLNSLFGSTDKAGKGAQTFGDRVRSIGGPVGAFFRTLEREGGKAVRGISRVFDGVGDDLRRIGHGLRDIGEFMLAGLRRALPGIRKVLIGLAQIVRGVVEVIAGILSLDFGKAWDGVKDIFRGSFKVLLGTVRWATALFREGFARIGHAMSRPLGAAFDWIEHALKNMLSFFLGGVTTLIDIVEELVQAAGHIPGVGGKFKAMGQDMEDARKSIDRYRESLRKTDAEHKRDKAIKDARHDVRLYKDILEKTAKESQGYRQTAQKLEDAQHRLNKVTRDSKPATDRARKGVHGLRGNLIELGDTLGDVTAYTLGETNRMLQEFGAKRIDMSVKRFHSGQRGGGFNTSARGGWAGAGPWIQGFEGGGWLEGDGMVGHDRIPVLAAPGEGFVTRHQRPIFEHALQVAQAVGAMPWGSMNEVFANVTRPHYMAAGGFAPMVSAANRVDRAGFPYSWGGGHQGSPAPFGPFDCSGAVSYVLQKGGIDIPTMVSGQMQSIGKPGEGQVSIFANPGHVFMRILGRYFGTSGENPGGGAGWFSGGTPSYRAGFTARHFGTEDIGMIGTLARLLVRGGTRSMRGIAQGSADRLRKAANRYLSRQGGGGGDAGDPGPGFGIRSAAQFLPFWNEINPDARRYGPHFARIIPRESGWNPRAGGPGTSNPTHAGWYQFDSPTWGDFRPPGSLGWPQGPYSPASSTRAAGNVTRREGLAGVMSRWAQTFQSGGFVSGKGRLTRKGRRGLERWSGVADDQADKIEDIGQRYDLASRRFDFTEEEFVNEGDENTPPSLNMRAIEHRAGELRKLIRFREQQVHAYKRMVRYLKRVEHVYNMLVHRIETIMRGIRKRLSHLPKGKEGRRKRESLQHRLKSYRKRLGIAEDNRDEAVDRRQGAGFELQSTELDVDELRHELDPLTKSLSGKPGGVELPDFEAPDIGGDIGGGGAGDADASARADALAAQLAASQEALAGARAGFSQLMSPGDIGAGGPTALAAATNPYSYGGTGNVAGQYSIDENGQLVGAGGAVVIVNSQSLIPGGPDEYRRVGEAVTVGLGYQPYQIATVERQG